MSYAILTYIYIYIYDAFRVWYSKQVWLIHIFMICAVAALTPSGGGDKYIPAHKRMAMNGGSSYSRRVNLCMGILLIEPCIPQYHHARSPFSLFTLLWAAIKRMMSLLWGFRTLPRKPQTMTWGMCVHARLSIFIVLVSHFTMTTLSLCYIHVFSRAHSYSTSLDRFSAFILPQQRPTAPFALYHPYDMITRKWHVVIRLLIQSRDKTVLQPLVTLYN